MSVLDKLETAKNVFAGDAIGLAIGKATSHEMVVPKKKHVEFILRAISIEKINIAQIGDGLIARINNSSFIVVFKSLLTCHHLFIYGHERFLSYMATKPESWTYPAITDSNLPNGTIICMAMKPYSEFLNAKCTAYRFLAFNCCNFKESKDAIKSFGNDKIIKYTFYMQNLMDSLLAAKIDSRALMSKLCSMSAHMLFRDFIRLYAVLNEVQINLIERYFDLKVKEAKQAFSIYKRFYDCHDGIDQFYVMAREVCIPDSEIPSLTKPPLSLLEAMESHLVSLEKPNQKVDSFAKQNTQSQSTKNESTAFVLQASNEFKNIAPQQANNNLLDYADIFSEPSQPFNQVQSSNQNNFQSNAFDNCLFGAPQQQSQSASFNNLGFDSSNLFNSQQQFGNFLSSQQPSAISSTNNLFYSQPNQSLFDMQSRNTNLSSQQLTAQTYSNSTNSLTQSNSLFLSQPLFMSSYQQTATDSTNNVLNQAPKSNQPVVDNQQNKQIDIDSYMLKFVDLGNSNEPKMGSSNQFKQPTPVMRTDGAGFAQNSSGSLNPFISTTSSTPTYTPMNGQNTVPNFGMNNPNSSYNPFMQSNTTPFNNQINMSNQNSQFPNSSGNNNSLI